MALYIGNTCPVCGEKFKDGDDAVLCPDCGTPYHRECWQKPGGCLHQAEHAAGFEWQPEPAGGSADAEDAVCPNCGTHNAPSAPRRAAASGGAAPFRGNRHPHLRPRPAAPPEL